MYKKQVTKEQALQKLKHYCAYQERCHSEAKDKLYQLFPIVTFSVVVTVVTSVVMLDLRIGDLDAGAPELRPDSRYNRDNAYITQNYGLSSDQFVVIMKTEDEGCRLYASLQKMDGLAQLLRENPAVQTTTSLAETVRFVTSATMEGSGKWLTLSRNKSITDGAVSAAIIAARHHQPELFRVTTDCLSNRPQSGHAQFRAENRRGLRQCK